MEKPVVQKAKPFVFLKEVRTELSKVAWPRKEQAIRLTLIVVGVSLITAFFLGSFDFFFTKLMAVILQR